MMQSNWNRQDNTDAREMIFGLLGSGAHVEEAVLQHEAGLTPRLFERAILELLNEGRVRRHTHGNRPPTYSVPTGISDPPSSSMDVLSREARAVLEYLRVAPNTARQIALSLGIHTEDVHRILNDLEGRDLVSFRYVGQLNVYRAC